jgi:hypothetical protein
LLNLERRNRAGGGAPTGANRIGDTAVLKYCPTETLPLLSAMLLDFAGLCRPYCLDSSPYRRKTRAFPGTKAKSGERRTVCWREMDSNLQYRAVKGKFVPRCERFPAGYSKECGDREIEEFCV